MTFLVCTLAVVVGMEVRALVRSTIEQAREWHFQRRVARDPRAYYDGLSAATMFMPVDVVPVAVARIAVSSPQHRAALIDAVRKLEAQ